MILLTIVLPFYRRAAIFSDTLARNSLYLRQGYEILVVMDDPEGTDEVLAVASKYPQASWQVVLNEQSHAWRNPAKAINVGIRNARSEYVLVGSPETVWITDVPAILFSKAQTEQQHFHFGEITFASPEEIRHVNDLQGRVKYSCGSICTKKSNIEAVGGYDESLIGWGVDDDNLRARLALMGIHGRLHRGAQLLHPPQVERHRFYSSDTAGRIRELVKPPVARVNGSNWGRDFNKVIFQTP